MTMTHEMAADTAEQTALAFARCFNGADGDRVLAHLGRITVSRTAGPDASDASLRDLEGQRRLYAYILKQIERGQTPPNHPD